jgi:hypothetical protein
VAPVEDIVVIWPFPVNAYHTPFADVATEAGGVSSALPTVVPAKLLVAQGKFVAPEHASLDGLTAIEIEAVPEHPFAREAVIV